MISDWKNTLKTPFVKGKKIHHLQLYNGPPHKNEKRLLGKIDWFYSRVFFESRLL